MKKIFLLAFLLIWSISAHAIIAPKTTHRYVQPDGSVVNIQINGDEFYHWTTIDGMTVIKDDEGFYRYAPERAMINRRARASALRNQRNRMNLSLSSRNELALGDRNFLVLLIEFDDLEMTTPSAAKAISNILNKDGYSDNGATGSLWNYMYDNSCGKFNPTFDVYGPYKLSKDYAYYGANDEDAAKDTDSNLIEGLYEACTLADEDVDFSKYDLDGDGYIDNIIFIYAGYNEAEGGGDDTIWPHAYTFQSADSNYRGETLDGKLLRDYVCVSEYKGAEGENPFGIGSLAHEFSHFLGLPDFYDVDGDENGKTQTIGEFSIMNYGSYNNDSKTPPFYSIYERFILGWVTDIPTLPEGEVTIGPVYDNEGYVIDCSTDGEFIVFETRDGSSWDAYIPQGMLVYHGDRSENEVYGVKASIRWLNNTLNAYSDHPCYYLVEAKGGKIGYHPFPGLGKVTSLTPKDWNGNPAGYKITHITYDNSTISFTSEKLATAVGGTVVDIDGNPISGVSLTMDSYSAETDSDGNYSIEAPAGEYTLTASKDGYESETEIVTLTIGTTAVNFTLVKPGESKPVTLKKYQDENYVTGFGTNPESIMASVVFTADEIEEYAGRVLESVCFYISGSTATSVNIMVYSGEERVLIKEVQKPKFYPYANVVDVKAAKITLEKGKDLRLAYALEDIDSEMPIVVDYASDGLNSYYASYDLENPSWHSLDADSGGNNIKISGTVGNSLSYYESKLSTVSSSVGFNYIYCDSDTFKTGYSYAFSLAITSYTSVDSMTWYLDGVQCDPYMAFDAGSHTVSVHVTYTDGKKAIIEKQLVVS